MADDTSSSMLAKGECKLFGTLLTLLQKEPSAYAILNSRGDVDIQSMGWPQLPPGDRASAVEMARGMMGLGTSQRRASKKVEYERKETVGDCKIHVGIIIVGTSMHWAMVSVASQDPAVQRLVAREETHPLCHWGDDDADALSES